MATKFKPLLAYTIEDTSKLKYPVLASIKLDGIRVVILDGVVYSRSMKPIRSKTVQKLFGRPELNGLDGELLYGDWGAPNVFNLTTQACMSTDLKAEFSESEISMAVFDYVLSDKPYVDRKSIAADIVLAQTVVNQSQIQMLGQEIVHNEDALLTLETKALDLGYEGVMVRSMSGKYKQGRSTEKEGYIGKLKRFCDAEAVVIGFEEKLINTNEAKINELGYQERSSSKAGMVGAGTLGALVCECNGIRFTMGSGFDDAGRKEVWDNREEYIGKLVSFKYFAIGMKNSFRFPIFKGFRDKDDIGE